MDVFVSNSMKDSLCLVRQESYCVIVCLLFVFMCTFTSGCASVRLDVCWCVWLASICMLVSLTWSCDVNHIFSRMTKIVQTWIWWVNTRHDNRSSFHWFPSQSLLGLFKYVDTHDEIIFSVRLSSSHFSSFFVCCHRCCIFHFSVLITTFAAITISCTFSRIFIFLPSFLFPLVWCFFLLWNDFYFWISLFVLVRTIQAKHWSGIVAFCFICFIVFILFTCFAIAWNTSFSFFFHLSM